MNSFLSAFGKSNHTISSNNQLAKVVLNESFEEKLDFLSCNVP